MRENGQSAVFRKLEEVYGQAYALACGVRYGYGNTPAKEAIGWWVYYQPEGMRWLGKNRTEALLALEAERQLREMERG